MGLARARDREAGLPADRPRPDEGRAVAVRSGDRTCRARGDGRTRAAPIRRRRARPGTPRLSSPSSRSPTCGASRKHSRSRWSAGSTTSRWRRRRGALPIASGVFVDYGQNARDRTIASAYSVRATSDARVSAPLLWDEVASVEPAAFTVETMTARLGSIGDPMRGMWKNPPSLGRRFSARARIVLVTVKST